MDFVYMMSMKLAYVNKTTKNETINLWHARLRHVGYNRLKVMIKKQMLKGLP